MDLMKLQMHPEWRMEKVCEARVVDMGAETWGMFPSKKRMFRIRANC
jgi:hypothetical protein